jgi:hypothetical protein
MKSMITKLSNARYRFLALTSVMAVTAVDQAQAAASSTTVGAAASQMMDQITNVGKVSIAGSFLGGIYMLAGGLMKLKAASESQGQQTPYSAGMWRLALGGGLVALPALAGMMTQSAGLGGIQMSDANNF